MRSISQILWAVLDKEINTPAEGDALITEESREYAVVLKITEAEARAQLLENIDHAAALCLRSDAAKLRAVFRITPRH